MVVVEMTTVMAARAPTMWRCCSEGSDDRDGDGNGSNGRGVGVW